MQPTSRIMNACCICREAKEDIFSAHKKFEHQFCKECIVHWIESSNNLDCPVCHCLMDNCRSFFDDKSKLLPLLFRRENGNVPYDMIRELLEEGLDPGHNRIGLLKKAVKHGKVDIVKMLMTQLKSVPYINPSGLVKTGQFDLLQYFMTAENVKAYGRHVLYELVKHDKLKIAPDNMVSSRVADWIAPMVLAAQLGNHEALKTGFEMMGKYVRDYYFLIIGAAILAGKVETVKWILHSYPVPVAIPQKRLGRNCTRSIHRYKISLPTKFSEYFKYKFDSYCDCCTTPLALACRIGNLDLVQEMHTKYNMDICANDCSSLFSALASKNCALIKYLLDNGVDVTARKNYALHYAADMNESEMFNLLWEYGKEKVSNEVYRKLVRSLIGCKNSTQTVMLIKERNANPLLALGEKDLIFGLKRASRGNCLDLAKILLEHSLYEHVRGNTLTCIQEVLNMACKKGRTEIVEIFLRQQPILLRLEGAHRYLILAINNKRDETAKLLIRCGAALNCCMEMSPLGHKHQSLLSAAVLLNMDDVAEMLVEHGVDVSRDSKSILLKLCQYGNVHLLEKIVDAGCIYKHFIKDLLITAAANDQVGVLRFFRQKGDEVYFEGRIMREAIRSNSIRVVNVLSAETLSAANIVRLWNCVLSRATDVEITRHLANVYPFDQMKHKKKIRRCLKKGRLPVLQFLAEAGVKFDKLVKFVSFEFGQRPGLEVLILLAEVIDRWIGRFHRRLFRMALTERHRRLLDILETKFGNEKILQEVVLCLQSFATERQCYDVRLARCLEHFLAKEYFCVPSFLNECLRVACISSDLAMLKQVLEKGADANAFDGKLLAYAAASEQIDIWDLLLDHGADPRRAQAMAVMQTMVERGEVDVICNLRKRGLVVDELIDVLPRKAVKAIGWDEFNRTLEQTELADDDDDRDGRSATASS